MGADLNGFAYCVLALTLLTGGGIWALNRASIHRHYQLADPTPQDHQDRGHFPNLDVVGGLTHG